MTGFGDVQTESEVAAAGFDAHILKPIDFPALLELLREAAARFPRVRQIVEAD
jgi:AmiR/NasT family two-component response regulator